MRRLGVDTSRIHPSGYHSSLLSPLARFLCRYDGTWDVKYDDGEEETYVDEELIRARSAAPVAPTNFPPELASHAGFMATLRVAASVMTEGTPRTDLPDSARRGPKPHRSHSGGGGAGDGEVTARTARDQTLSTLAEVGEAGEAGDVAEPSEVVAKSQRPTTQEREDEEAAGGAVAQATPIKAEPPASATAAGSGRFDVGASVEANYRGKGKWYPGNISRDRRDGTYDVDYDDGEKETRVGAEFIRPVDAPALPAVESAAPLPLASPSLPLSLNEGDTVVADYRGRGKYYPGKISRVRLNGTYDVDYDDGEKELGVHAEFIRPLGGSPKKAAAAAAATRLEEGDAVEANYRGKGEWYLGTVSRARGDGSYDVRYDDGEKETRVGESLVRPRGSTGGGGAAPALGASKKLEAGDKVDANFRGRGKYYPGTVSRVRLNDTYDVDYDDGEREMRVTPDLIRPRGGGLSATRREGDKVEANYRGKGKWYPGNISRDRRDGTYDVDYDDGEKETRVGADFIRPRGRDGGGGGGGGGGGSLEVGDKVEADYRGKGRYYPGKIVRDRRDGTYDVDYDDGEKETRVDEKLIRPMDKTQSSHPAATDRDTWGAAAAPRTKPSKKKWKGGKVVRKYADGTYDIELAGGGLLTRVQRAVIRPLSAAHGGKTVLPHDD